jgi:hypothetical protein
MPRKPKPKSADPAEYKRFLETAKAVEASEDPKEFEKAFKTVARTSRLVRQKTV